MIVAYLSFGEMMVGDEAFHLRRNAMQKFRPQFNWRAIAGR
jgi:hypothetical protein